jgi:hypothetical protein
MVASSQSTAGGSAAPLSAWPAAGRHPARTGRRVTHPGSDGRLLFARCLERQGKFSAAAASYDKVIAAPTPDHDATWEAALRRAFLHIYLAGDQVPAIEVAR